jgi:SAM-dependent methyltransferase
VIGLDLSRETLAGAREDAATRGLDNLRYEEGSVYELPFAEASFDVVYAHQVLQHLREPAAALTEMRRVLRPGGLITVRDVDWGTAAYWPADPWIDRFVEVHFKTWYRNGGEPRMGRRLRTLFNATNVADLQITAAAWCYATPEETTDWGEPYAQRLLTSPMGERAVEYGYASRSDLEAMAAAFPGVDGPPRRILGFPARCGPGAEARLTDAAAGKGADRCDVRTEDRRTPWTVRRGRPVKRFAQRMTFDGDVGSRESLRAARAAPGRPARRLSTSRRAL